MGAALDVRVAVQGRGLNEDLELWPVRIPAAEGDYEAVIVCLHDTAAPRLEGVGEAPVVPGRSGPMDALLRDLRSGRPTSPAARSALETARLDLEARKRGVPLTELLGGARRRSVTCSALLTESRPDLLARAVERAVALGFGTFKLKAVNGGGMVDQERLGAARWAAGPGGRLRIDFNGRLAAGEAALALSRLRSFRIEMFEQPLPPGASATEWSALAAQFGPAVAADESLSDPERALELAAGGVTLAPKLATVGGPAAVIDLLRRASGPITIGSSLESSIGLVAALHVACALDRDPVACGLATRGRLDDDLVRIPLEAGPTLSLPGGPGLGVELDRRALRAYAVEIDDEPAARSPSRAVPGGPRVRRPARSRAGRPE